MFGSAELDDDSIKHFAKNDFYLADTLAGLEEQLYTCIKCLEQLTAKNGIASEGYWHGFQMLQNNKREFISLLESDPLFPVKFAYLLDRAFQNFVKDLGDYYEDDQPILKAKRQLKGQQADNIETAMSGFKMGSLSPLFLPRSLRAEPGHKARHPEPSKHGGSGGGQGSKPKPGRDPDPQKKTPPQPVEEWWAKNPHPVPEWQIPTGKNFGDFFDIRDAAKKPNTQGWPKFPHHKLKDNPSKHLCVRYQSTGECPSLHCYMAHVPPPKMDAATKQAVADRFKQIYA